MEHSWKERSAEFTRQKRAAFVESAMAVIRDTQEEMRQTQRDRRERWAAKLRLEGASIEGDALVVRFIEPNGGQINYRSLLRDADGYDAFDDP